MPGAIRPNKKAMKIAYTLLNTPKDQRQRNQSKAPEKMVQAWFRNSITSQ